MLPGRTFVPAIVMAAVVFGCTQSKELIERVNDSMTRGAEKLGRAVGGGGTAPPVSNAGEPLATEAEAPAQGAGAKTEEAGKGSAIPKDRTAISTLQPGPYQASKFAIGVDIDVMHYRAENPGDGLVHAPALTNYLNELYARIKGATGLTGIPGQVWLRPDSAYMGLATPDGNIFISIGQIRDIQCEDQAVALIAHELGHVVLRHHDSDSARIMAQQVSGVNSLLGGQITNALSRIPTPPTPTRGLPGLPGVPGTTRSLAPAGSANPITAPQGDGSGDRPLIGANILGVEISVLDDLLFPAWNRSQEADADRFALDIAKRLGYSFATGLKEWLEQVEEFEAQMKAGNVSSTGTRRRRGQQGQVPGFDLNAWAGERLAAARRTHASNRVESIFPYFEQHYGEQESRPEQKCGRLPAIKDSREMKALFEAYDLAFEIDGLIRARDRARTRDPIAPKEREEIAALAQKLERNSTPFDRHPMILNRLYRAQQLTGHRNAPAVQARAMRSPELAWITIRTQADIIGSNPNARADAVKVLMDGFRRLKEPPKLLPTMIQRLNFWGDRDEANRLHLSCLSKVPDLRDLCNRAQRSGLR